MQLKLLSHAEMKMINFSHDQLKTLKLATSLSILYLTVLTLF